MGSSILLQTTVNQARLAIGQRPLVGLGGFANQPAFTMADEVRNFLLSPPFAWRWNRQIIQFNTEVGVQDYTYAANWAISTVYGQYALVTDSNGAVQQATVAGTSGGAPPAWNVTVGGSTPSDGTVTWVNIGDEGLGQSLADFGWLELASASFNGNAIEIEVANDLGDTSIQTQPQKIAARLDDGAGGISFRIFPAPDQIYTVKLSYQKAALKFANLTDTWYPIPDYFSYLYSIGFRAKAYEYAGDERSPMALQMFFREALSANEGLSDAQKNLFLDHFLNTARETQSLQKGGQ